MHPAHARNRKARKAYPDKLFYKIGEISRITGVEPYVLRYWETEFPFLRPRKSRSGQRIYAKKDLDIILEVKDLLYRERYTIEGVRKRLGEIGHGRRFQQRGGVDNVLSVNETIEHTKRRLREIISQIK
jgi:DNA-binding transcriptional MerR regulator